MRTWAPAIFLAVILLFLLPAVPAALKKTLRRHPARLFILPALLIAVFCFCAWRSGALNLPLALLIIAYTLIPTVLIFVQGTDAGVATWLDFIVILALWLPVELNLGSQWIPKHAQGFLHTVAYGVALALPGDISPPAAGAPARHPPPDPQANTPGPAVGRVPRECA